jgi:uncharacterized membrane protein
MKYLTVIVCVLLVNYGQLIIKHEVNRLGPIPAGSMKEISSYFVKAIFNLGVLSGLFSALIVVLVWIAAMSKFELSSLYPFLSLNFVLVPLLSIYLFGESVNLHKGIGIGLICLGVFIFSMGK